jgi:amidase
VLLDSYLPDEDATVVERVLDAGTIILGKAVCESLCFSGAARATPPAGPRAHGCRR